MSQPRITLFDAVREFMGIVHAHASRLLDECSDETPVTVTIAGYEVPMTLGTLKRMDRAYMQAHADKWAKSDHKQKTGLFSR